ncbi:MAG: N-acetyltransferase [Lachnospiraceae bacterium]|nr:N-acetyltransferase [Lachnospiraceae bacterium]
MKNIYQECPVLKNDTYMFRKTELKDAHELLKVYSDKNALPFFNSDNCDGDNFYYPTEERMTEALKFWNMAYENKWFARLSIVDIKNNKIIGTMEGVKRASEDAFDGCGILRLDVGSQYEKEDIISDMIDIVLKDFYELFDCSTIITKIPNYAVERAAAATKLGFKKSNDLLIGTKDGYAYNGYWIIHR